MSNTPTPAPGLQPATPEPPTHASQHAPGALRQFWSDLFPKNAPDWLVPPRSGLTPPDPNVEWITEAIASSPEALGQTRRAHDLERDRADSLEKKAIAVVSLCLSLLATALIIGGYQLGYLRRHQSSMWWLLAPAAVSIACLVFTAINALEVQRVGIYQWEGAEPLGRQPGGLLGLVQAEEQGRQLAHWTAGNKANGFLQTRAWLSRALIALILSAFVTIGMATKPTVPPRGSGGSRPPPAAATTTVHAPSSPSRAAP
jgi:hypothetical protein